MRFRQAGTDFEPCSQFGIGFMSYFMLGDRIRIETRRDYGHERGLGSPLIVEINGLGGILVIRPGKQSQKAGTTVTITSRDKQSYVDKLSDKVSLISIINGYAIATEFPIHARCSVPQISQELHIPSGFVPWPTLIEESGVKNYVTIEQPFSEIDERMTGTIRQSYLVNEDGYPTLENSEASWCVKRKHNHRKGIILKLKDGKEFEYHRSDREGQLCEDGILVCGYPGRGKLEGRLGHRTNQLNVGAYYTLDVRGTLKPELTPARIPPENFPYSNPKWMCLYKLIALAAGRMWEKFTDYLEKGLKPEEYWILVFIHDGPLKMMRNKYIWGNISISLLDSHNRYQWRKLETLTKLYLKSDGKDINIITPDGLCVAHTNNYKEWLSSEGTNGDPDWRMKSLIISMSTLSIGNGEVILNLSPPTQPDKAPVEFILNRDFPPFNFLTLPYLDSLVNVMTVQSPITTANRNHPLVKYMLENQDVDKQSSLQEFAKSAVLCLSDKDTLDEFDSKSPNRWMKYVAHKFFEVDWSKYNNELRPPYQIWLKNKGMIKITEKDFIDWKNIKTET
jgi:hypothetical protein